MKKQEPTWFDQKWWQNRLIPFLVGFSGQILFVDAQKGEDRGRNGEDPNFPLQTINQAHLLCQSGDAIIMRGTFFEELLVTEKTLFIVGVDKATWRYPRGGCALSSKGMCNLLDMIFEQIPPADRRPPDPDGFGITLQMPSTVQTTIRPVTIRTTNDEDRITLTGGMRVADFMIGSKGPD